MQYNNTRRKEYDMQTADLNMFTGTEGYIRYNMPHKLFAYITEVIDEHSAVRPSRFVAIHVIIVSKL